MPTIVETRICKQTGQEYEVLQEELDLLEQISPVLNGKKYLIPISQYHPDVNHQRHLAWRNERTLYRGKCDFTGDSLITNINPKQWYTIYNHHDYRSDKFDPMKWGRDIDSGKWFTEQFGAMFRAMPQSSLALLVGLENCDYCNHGYQSKDCYMCTSPTWAEQCYYSSISIRCLRDVDGYTNTSCSYTYECVYSMNCYECKRAMYSNDCKKSLYLLDCRNCEECFACVNLNHKKYCIFNEQYNKETYTIKVQELYQQYTQDELLKFFYKFSLQQPRRATRGSWNEESVGDLLFGTTKNYKCFYVQDARDCCYCRVSGFKASDVHRSDLSGIWMRMYECMWNAEGNKQAWCISSNTLENCYYCFFCNNCEYCFWCVALKHKKYCIFNKQYSKEEYEKKLAKLIEEMIKREERGNFFHPSISYFPYNDSDAYERFPESKEEIVEKWRKWIDKEEKKFEGVVYTPLNIKKYKNNPEKQKELLSWTLVCEVSWKPYRIIKQELDFYMKFDIEIPKKHSDTRYQERIQHRRLPRKLYERKCAKTWVDILTPYAPDRPEIIRSEEVWDQEFLG